MQTPLSQMTGEQLLAARVLGTAAAGEVNRELDRRAREGLTDRYTAVLDTVASLKAAQDPRIKTTPLNTAA
ncbi:MAG: hypothetical protein ACOC7R_02395 [Planctomycetota bacterium]